VVIRALLAALLLPGLAWAQRGGCGYGMGLDGLRGADAALAEGSTAGALSIGRAAGAAVAAPLREAATRFTGCGCPRLAEFAAEAAALADQAQSEASLGRVRQMLDRARFSVAQARERAGRQGCS
jgi:hypothetical protein